MTRDLTEDNTFPKKGKIYDNYPNDEEEEKDDGIPPIGNLDDDDDD